MMYQCWFFDEPNVKKDISADSPQEASIKFAKLWDDTEMQGRNLVDSLIDRTVFVRPSFRDSLYRYLVKTDLELIYDSKEIK